ncbi:Nitrate reductase gamma subunit [Desulfonispora thiosulfatigenes DSM 11270]|uniref:Nitrate reductase gamma subunit n=1 Tax=Desulfonispora thiosulfatigenes DSM 11270 TaxID=656914 RepID=A0A1W1UGP7_DESTI|nr:respiratory nitrate reductase subunit gamma [Desulfonispora thiosulfatigenes]SMB80213.1 Nitrate reductase gamma subunit [Desulfonispora thiosulfatigenes DSM 11270]
MEIFFRVMAFAAIAIFGIGVFYRISLWNQTPIPHRQTLYPAPTTKAEANFKIAKELALFQTLFENDKPLWVGSWIFHVGLAGAIFGHFVGIPTLGEQFAIVPGISVELSKQLSSILGTAAGLMLLYGLVHLLIRRSTVREVKIISDPMDFFDLFLLLGIVGTGNLMRFLTPIEYIEAKNFVIDIFTFSPIAIPSNTTFLIHFTLVMVLLMYFPFSKLMHFLGSIYTRAISTRPGTGTYQTDQVRLNSVDQKVNRGV